MFTANPQGNRRMERLDALLIVPALPTVARRIVLVASDASVDPERVVEAVEQNPEITARLLGLANSAFYGGGGVRQVKTLGDAISRVLGLDATRSLALAFSLASVFNPHRCRQFDVERYWRNALMTADLTQRFANHVRGTERLSLALAFTAGLVANLGLMALAHALPVQLDKAITMSWGAPLSIGEALQRALGFDHHHAGARLARNWRLATTLGNVMAHHHDLDYRAFDWPLVSLVGAASRYADPGLERIDPSRDSDGALTRLGVSRSWRDTAIAECARRRDALAAMASDFA